MQLTHQGPPGCHQHAKKSLIIIHRSKTIELHQITNQKLWTVNRITKSQTTTSNQRVEGAMIIAGVGPKLPKTVINYPLIAHDCGRKKKTLR